MTLCIKIDNLKPVFLHKKPCRKLLHVTVMFKLMNGFITLRIHILGPLQKLTSSTITCIDVNIIYLRQDVV